MRFQLDRAIVCGQRFRKAALALAKCHHLQPGLRVGAKCQASLELSPRVFVAALFDVGGRAAPNQATFSPMKNAP